MRRDDDEVLSLDNELEPLSSTIITNYQHDIQYMSRAKAKWGDRSRFKEKFKNKYFDKQQEHAK